MAYGGDERRDFFRIVDNLLIEFRQVAPEEAAALEKSLKEDWFPSKPVPQLPKHFPVSEELQAYLENMDRKLNTIIGMLSQKHDSYESRRVAADISGSGIRYRSDLGLDVGAFLELRIEFPFSLSPKVTVLGKVVRSHEISTVGMERWDIAITFVSINEKDRDALISYIFSRERQHLLAMKKQ